MGRRVAFCAVASSPISIIGNTTVPFNKILTNIGRVYNSHGDHTFIAPIHGVYILTYSILNHEGNGVINKMVKNGVLLAATRHDSDDNNMGSQTIIVELVHGDRVWVHTSVATHHESLFTEPYNTFCGALLWEMN